MSDPTTKEKVNKIERKIKFKKLSNDLNINLIEVSKKAIFLLQN